MWLRFVCSGLFLSITATAFGQDHLPTVRKPADKQRFSFTRPQMFKAVPVPQNYTLSQQAFFCRQELKLEKKVGFPIQFRLGSFEQCNRLEGKLKWATTSNRRIICNPLVLLGAVLLPYQAIPLTMVGEQQNVKTMKQIFLLAGLLFIFSAGLSSCAVEATTYPYYHEPQVRTRIYYDSRPQYYRHYHHHRRYYAPRGYYYRAPRGYYYRY